MLPQTVLLVFILFTGGCNASKWKYKGPTGVDRWHELFPTACDGLQQSPIDIQPEQTLYNPELKDFALWYDPPRPGSQMFVKNNGHAIQVDTVGEFYVTNGGLNNIYKVAQFHFHWGSEDHKGSEHLLDSTAYPIEMHIVTFNNDRFNTIGEAVTEKGGLAVLGVLFEVQEEPNPAFQPIISALEAVKDPGLGKTLEIDPLPLRDLLPANIDRYYRYNGSLTTPGCFETVTWTVFHEKQKISFGQLLKFRRVLQHRHHKHGHNHHKRSVRGRAVREADHSVLDVLDEMGITDDQVQQGELIATLATRKNKGRRGKNRRGRKNRKQIRSTPTTNHQSTAMAQYSPAPVEEQPANEDAVVLTESVIDVETLRREEAALKEEVALLEAQNAAEKQGEEPAVNQPETPVNQAEEEWIQENLVDNYRPVQPINDRLVYRSFKLKDLYEAKPSYRVIPQNEPPHFNKPQPSQTKTTKKSANSGSQVKMSVLTLITVSLLSTLL